MAPAVSVVVPVYNVEKYLRECLDSIVSQTLQNIEIICINDGSTDNSLEILHEYAQKDSRIRVISKKNTGYGNTMNIGLQNCKGKYIGIVESDDFIVPEMFETLYRMAIDNDLDVAKACYYIYTEIGRSKKVKFNNIPKNMLFNPIVETSIFSMVPSIWTGLYRKDFLEENQLKFLETPGASYQDTSFSVKVLLTARRFMLSDKALLYYRCDNANSSVKSKDKIYCICDEYAEVERCCDMWGVDGRVRSIVARKKFYGYRWNFDRISISKRYEFLKKWMEEVKKDREYLPNFWEVNLILRSPSMYHLMWIIRGYLYELYCSLRK